MSNGKRTGTGRSDSGDGELPGAAMLPGRPMSYCRILYDITTSAPDSLGSDNVPCRSGIPWLSILSPPTCPILDQQLSSELSISPEGVDQHYPPHVIPRVAEIPPK
jgi:hypothetical protein